jgi:hypothetical protein
MGGFFLRPKDTNLDKTKGHINAETILPSQDGVDLEYIEPTGFNSSTDGISGAFHFRDPERREAAPGSPLPSGGKSPGISSPGVRGWNTSVSRNVSSGFGKGTRAGKTGVRSK